MSVNYNQVFLINMDTEADYTAVLIELYFDLERQVLGDNDFFHQLLHQLTVYEI